MAKQIKKIMTRTADTLLADVFGALSLMAMLVGVLYLPTLI